MNKMATKYSGYYAPTAYDSARLRPFIPVDNSRFGYLVRTFRRNMLANHGSAQCCEFFSDYDSYFTIERLRDNSPEVREFLEAPYHQLLHWETFRNPKAMIRVFTGLMLIFSVTSWAVIFIILLLFLFDEPSSVLSIDYLDFFAIPMIITVIHLIGRAILRSDTVKDKNNILFDRRRGIISIPRKKSPPLELSFGEFDGYLGSTVNPSGLKIYHLILAHRSTASFVQNPAGSMDAWRICVQWEFMQRYMDISQPLPDIPSVEPFRAKDPVTAAYDKEHDRPVRYWRDMDDETAKIMLDASEEAAKNYPWGLTREQAFASGWRPSECGEGAWRGKVEEFGPYELDDKAVPDFSGRLRIR